MTPSSRDDYYCYYTGLLDVSLGHVPNRFLPPSGRIFSPFLFSSGEPYAYFLAYFIVQADSTQPT